VLPIRYDFEYISRKVHGKLVNDAGARDMWPVLAKFGSWGYGPSGTFGFQSALIEDRFHNYSHSDFFNQEFVRKFWLPIFSREEVVRSTYERKPSWRTSTLSLLAAWPSGTVPTVLIAAALYLGAPVMHDLYRQARGIRVEFAKIDAERESRVTAPVAPPAGPATTPATPAAPPVPVKPAAPVASDDEIIARIVKWEGGYSNPPGMPASFVSNGGVSAKDWELYSGKPASPDTIRNLTSSQISDFYRAVFLQRPGVKDIQSFAVKGALVDMMVLDGAPKAVRAFQTALNGSFGGRVPVDGELGPGTVAAINSAKDPNSLIEIASCTSLKSKRPPFTSFQRRRVLDYLPGTPNGACPDLL
jgi:hypothetical protein